MSIISIQNSLAAGELSPALFGRTDVEKWHSGTSTCRNFFVNYRGGVSSRAGLAYVGTCLQPGTANPPRDIPFQFSLSQGYALEFGDQYLRIKVNGAYVLETPVSVSSINSTGLFTTSGAHGYSIGDWVFDSGNDEFDGLAWIIDAVPTPTTFTVKDLFDWHIGLTTPDTSTATVARIYTVVSPYAAVDLPYLKYTQSADTMTLCCVNPETLTEYPPYSLVRHAQTSWIFTQETFASNISAPTNLTATPTSSTTPSTWYSYVVTAVSRATGEESVQSNIANVFNNDIAINAGTNTLSWTGVAGADSYNVYASTPSYGLEAPISVIFGFIGSATGPGFVDTNIIPDFSVTAPIHNNPFSRGPVKDVVMTAQGNNYSNETVGYSVTTSTGTGFTGIPVVVNSKVTGMFITNQGSGYQPGDTITFTDSGGGTATGYVNFSANPTDRTLINLNGVDLEFVSEQEGTSAQQISIGHTTAITLQSLANLCNASQITNLFVATYTTDGVKLFVTYKTHGTAGNSYSLNAGSVGGATVSGATLTGGGTAGTGATATLTIGAETGTYPSVPAYFQQRRVYANTLNFPDTYFMSRPGLYTNFDSSIPTGDSDSITGTPWAQQINGIQWLVPMPGGLVVLTGRGAWQLNGGGQSVPVTPANQIATPQAYNGVHTHVPPIVINYDMLTVQSKGSIVRDLAYNFWINIYTGTDLTLLSNHLFVNSQIEQWAWAEEPFKTLWVITADGKMLCLTYLKEQEVAAWTRHDTNGLFVSICAITETSNPNVSGKDIAPLVDSVYVITKRYVKGAWRYYSERMNNRLWQNVEDSFCVDSGVLSPQTYPNATLTPGASTGTGVSFTTNSSVFTVDNVGDVIRTGGGKATVTAYVSGTEITCDITEDIVDVLPENPDAMPVPAIPGLWTISTPMTIIEDLNHLEGQEVAILADGSVVPNQVVIEGTVTLPIAASKVVVGLPYICQVQTLYADHPDGNNTSQNRRKLISAAGIRVEASRGLQVGADQPDQSTFSNTPTNPTWTDMNEIKERNNSVNAGVAVPLFTGDYYKTVQTGWDLKGQLAVQQVYPLPANITAIILYWSLGDMK